MRLIDGDALEKFLSDAEMEAIKRKKHVLAGALNMIQGNVRNFPTIEPEPHWISCKERLPDLWDYVLCSQINGDVGEGKLLDDGYWHICYDQSHRKKSWVVAWQPLPEKFKEEGGEE